MYSYSKDNYHLFELMPSHLEQQLYKEYLKFNNEEQPSQKKLNEISLTMNLERDFPLPSYIFFPKIDYVPMDTQKLEGITQQIFFENSSIDPFCKLQNFSLDAGRESLTYSNQQPPTKKRKYTRKNQSSFNLLP